MTISTGTLLTQERITVTATNSGGSAASGFSLTVRPSLPAVVTAPALSGTGRIGAPVTVFPGSWSGGPSLACQWLAGGVAIAGATGTSYAPVAADDRKELAVRVTATNAGGSTEALTAGLAVTRTPPVAVAALGDIVTYQGAAALVLDAGRAFAGEGPCDSRWRAPARRCRRDRPGEPADDGGPRRGAGDGDRDELRRQRHHGLQGDGDRGAGERAAVPAHRAAPRRDGEDRLDADRGHRHLGRLSRADRARQWLRDGMAIAGATGASSPSRRRTTGGRSAAGCRRGTWWAPSSR